MAFSVVKLNDLFPSTLGRIIKLQVRALPGASVQRQRVTHEMRLTAVSDMTSPYLVSRRTHVPNDSLRTPRNSRLDRRDDRSGRQNRR